MALFLMCSQNTSFINVTNVEGAFVIPKFIYSSHPDIADWYGDLRGQ